MNDEDGEKMALASFLKVLGVPNSAIPFPLTREVTYLVLSEFSINLQMNYI